MDGGLVIKGDATVIVKSAQDITITQYDGSESAVDKPIAVSNEVNKSDKIKFSDEETGAAVAGDVRVDPSLVDDSGEEDIPVGDNQVSISFNANGGSGEMKAIAADIGKASALPENKFTKVGYSFSGWGKTETSGVNYKDKEEVSFTTNTVLYAQRSRMDGVVIVSFDANGGTGTMADQAFTAGESAKLNKNTFTRKGFSFFAWSTDTDEPMFVYGDE